MTVIAKRIRPEELSQCIFQKPPRLFTEYETSKRNQHLYLAMLLGNHRHHEMRIIFNTIDGYREVSSQVWATTEKSVLLQGGVAIPEEAIVAVELNQDTDWLF